VGEEGRQHLRHELAPGEILERGRKIHIVLSRQLAAAGSTTLTIVASRRLGCLISPARLSSPPRQVLISPPPLDADAGHARHCQWDPGQCLTSTTLSGPTPNFRPQPRRCASSDRIEHGDIAADDQILVGGDDGDDVAPRGGRLGIAAIRSSAS
jgi:hypothetical protein